MIVGSPGMCCGMCLAKQPRILVVAAADRGGGDDRDALAADRTPPPIAPAPAGQKQGDERVLITSLTARAFSFHAPALSCAEDFFGVLAELRRSRADFEVGVADIRKPLRT